MALSTIARERLENELLLNKGGGIYYDAARVDPDETTATLFVGLGGTGADMLIRIKNEVKRRMVLPQVNGKIVGDTPKNIGFLAFDTDKNTQAKTWGIATFDQFGSEFCSLSVDNLPSVVAERGRAAAAGDPVWDWYDGMDSVLALDGAGGYRQLGRLMLFENINKVHKTVQDKIKELVSANSGLKRVMIFVVAGIAGGTGSGTFIDMAFLLRSIASGAGVPNIRLFGYLVLPDVNLLNGGHRDRLWSNGFACLKELDYWMCPGADEQNDRFVQKYSSQVEVNMINARAFDYCHLLSAQDMEGRPLTYDKVIGSMAENVFAYIAGETGAQQSGNSSMSSMYDNIDNYMMSLSSKAPLPGCYRYLAVGTQKLEIPYEEISTLLAVRLFERLAPTLALRPTEESFQADLRALRLVPQQVIHSSLLERIPPSPADGNPNYQYGQIWGGGNDGHRRNRVFQDVYQWMAREYETNITRNSSTFADVMNGVFKNFIREKMMREDRGPTYLAALIKSDDQYSIIPLLTRMAEHCDSVAANCSSRQQALDQQLQMAYNAGHGKVIMRQKSVEGYIAALREWSDNENGILAYSTRAEVLRELRDKYFQKYHEKVFAKLGDVLDVLPGIFGINLTHIAIAQKEATEKGMLDDSRLVWPLKFEQENRSEFEKLLASATRGFLENLTVNLTKWVGSDLDSLDDTAGTATATDIPGFISRFIGEQFGGLLNINMEAIMKARLGGADDLDNYLHTQLLRLRDRSVPMFSIRPAYQNTSTAEFAIVSVPDDSLNIKAAANNYLKSDKVIVKDSKEKTRLYTVKVISGIPLYAYSAIEEAEREYEAAMRNGMTQKGAHLRGEWLSDYPSPLPEGAWTPGIYSNERTGVYNRRMREAFDVCVKNSVIVPDNPDAPTKYLLRIADVPTDYFDTLALSGTIADKIAVLEEERDRLWGGECVELTAIGVYKNTDGNHLLDCVRECALRLAKKCELIARQAGFLQAYENKAQELEDPRTFTDALLCGLIAKKGFEIIVKRSASSASFDVLYDTTSDLSFGEYEAYKKFRSLLDGARREEIKTFRTELLRRLPDSDIERAAARAAADA
ncbi:MAG: tubulin-like doman-containing protein, partial [Oscillospiraceae bacterium]|nr:tubulin-like doman-containing protein [Oscillospiraceae bacterium]